MDPPIILLRKIRGMTDTTNYSTTNYSTTNAFMPLLLVSAAALIDDDNRVLLTTRPPGKPLAGLWEFPGGKVHDGEAPDAALARELHEELGIEVPADHLNPLTFVYHPYSEFNLLLLLFWGREWEGIPTPREGQQLTWKRPRDMSNLPMPPADVPLVTALRDFLAGA